MGSSSPTMRITCEENAVVSPLKVEFQFDFGSPNAYLAEIALAGIERRTGVKFEYVPVLLGASTRLQTTCRPPSRFAASRTSQNIRRWRLSVSFSGTTSPTSGKTRFFP